MNISIASYAFHGLLAEGKMDVFGYLESLRYRYQLHAADIWNGMLPTTDDDFLRKVREAMDEKELRLANLCCDQTHLWEPDPAERERRYQNALAHLRGAVILGAETVRIDMGGHDPEMSDEQFDYTVKRYSEYARFAADHGFRVGPENHWGSSRYLINQQKVRDAVDHPAYGMLLHFGNWETGEHAANERAVAPWVMHTHVSAQIVDTCLDESLGVLLDAGYKGCWGVEHHSAKNEYIEVEWQLAEVRRALVRRASVQADVASGNPMLEKEN